MDHAQNASINTLLASRAADIARHAQVMQLKRMSTLMEAIAALAALGFLVTGFAAPAAAGQPLTVTVDDPDDELIERACGGNARGGTFTPARSRLWISFHGVRVEWEVVLEGRAAPDLDAMRFDPSN